jgi:uncharacterized damage-inducible protein DinB
MQHDIGHAQSAHSPYSQQVRIPRASTDEKDFSFPLLRWTAEQGFPFVGLREPERTTNMDQHACRSGLTCPTRINTVPRLKREIENIDFVYAIDCLRMLVKPVQNRKLTAEATEKEPIMFTKAGIIELHAATHERLDLLLRHVAAVPEGFHHKPISGFGHPSIWQQLVHILTCEEGWICDLQNQTFAGWNEKDCPNMEALLAAKHRIRAATRTFLGNLTEEQLNTTLTKRPVDWGGELRSPAFIVLHVITHAFHHKGQIVAMLRVIGYPAPDTDLQQV